MKKLVSAILSLAMAMMLCACGASRSDPASSAHGVGPGSAVKAESPTTDAPDDALAPASDEERGAQETAPETAAQAQDSLQEDAAQSADAAEETNENSTSLADDGFIRPEFKEAMDSYEAFFAEYAALMQAISDDPGDLTLLARYAAYMNRYTETMEALDGIEEDELTTAELSYYIEVMSRIQQLLLAAAG